jgi:hypothetical protein
MENNENTDKKGSIGHFMMLFLGFITALVGISYLVMSLMK